MSIVGDPFAKPLLQALDETPGRYDLSSRADHDLVGCDVEHRGQARAAEAHAAADHDRQLRLDRGHGHGRLRDDEGRRGADGRLPASGERHRHRRERQADRARQRQGRHGGAGRPVAGPAITRIRKRPRAPSAPSATAAIRFPAIARASKPTAPSRFWAAAAIASTRPAKRSIPKRSRKR